eukprot:2975123-Pyramimonas_sp.AAC.1
MWRTPSLAAVAWPGRCGGFPRPQLGRLARSHWAGSAEAQQCNETGRARGPCRPPRPLVPEQLLSGQGRGGLGPVK